MKDLVECSEWDPGFAGPEEYRMCTFLFKEKDTLFSFQRNLPLMMLDRW